MTITSRIHEELFKPVAAPTAAEAQRLLIRMPLSHPRGGAPDESSRTKRRRQRRRRAGADPNHLALAWTSEEHERFLRGLELFPRGPWKDVAHYVGTRTVRQTMTHAQKYRQKIARHKRGLQADALKKPQPVAVANAPTVDSAMPSPVLSVNAQAASNPEPTAVIATVTPTACAPGFQPLYSPSSMEEFAFDAQRVVSEDACWQGMVPVMPTAVMAPFSPPTTPLELGVFATPCAATVPMPYDDSDFGLPLDDAELDALVIDDVIHSVISQYLGPCPSDNVDVDIDAAFPATAAWSFV
jgi:SHAQKYF class myb-like DNA-binding protein